MENYVLKELSSGLELKSIWNNDGHTHIGFDEGRIIYQNFMLYDFTTP